MEHHKGYGLFPGPGAGTTQSGEEGFWPASFAAGRLAGTLGLSDDQEVSQARLNRLLKQPLKTSAQEGRRHPENLPPPPKHRDELSSHQCRAEFLDAEAEHLRSHHEMSSWAEVPRLEAEGHQVLDCMWVYTYKFDSAGFLRKCKARLVVRGASRPEG